MAEPFLEITLDNGLVVCFTDQTNRYFGDFHRICVQVTIEVSLVGVALTPELQQAVEKLKGPLSYTKKLERMGVAGGEVAAVRDQLVRDFLASGRDYLGRAEFPLQLLQKKLREKPQRNYLRH